MSREEVAAPGDNPRGQTPPAEPRKQAPSDHLMIIIISLSHCQLHVAGVSERGYYSALPEFPYHLSPVQGVDVAFCGKKKNFSVDAEVWEKHNAEYTDVGKKAGLLTVLELCPFL